MDFTNFSGGYKSDIEDSIKDIQWEIAELESQDEIDTDKINNLVSEVRHLERVMDFIDSEDKKIYAERDFRNFDTVLSEIEIKYGLENVDYPVHLFNVDSCIDDIEEHFDAVIIDSRTYFVSNIY